MSDNIQLIVIPMTKKLCLKSLLSLQSKRRLKVASHTDDWMFNHWHSV